MELFDRYSGKTVSEQDLPNQIDLGRYSIVDEEGRIRDVTYSNLPTKKAIRQELLLEKNKSLQEVFIDIAIDVEKAGNNNFSVIPLIRRIKNKLGLNEFEKLLHDKVFHLEEIFRIPHYLLDREIEKVHVSRAKRIPSKSYQYLASHTEDWVHKSIVSFKPSRILNEELELNLDIYENQLTVAFVERSLVYFSSRLKEIQDIISFLSEYQKLLKNRDDQNGWHKKIIRNLSLIGAVYEDDNFHGRSKGGSLLTDTEETLNQIHKRLLLLRKNELFEAVNKRATQSISLRNTNVLVNHKHYRYVKTLWVELDKVKPEKSESEKHKYEQDVIAGLRAYAKSVITYALSRNLNYQLHGNYGTLVAAHSELVKIAFNQADKGIFEIVIGTQKINVAVTGNLPERDEKLLSLLKAQNTYIFCFDDNRTNEESSRFVRISPLDPDSVERVGALLRKYLLIGYLQNLSKRYNFKQLLKEYVHYVPKQFLEFNGSNYSYYFHSYPKTKLSQEDVIGKIENDVSYKLRSRPDRENITKCMSELLNDIESQAATLKDEHLQCFNCGEKLLPYNIDRLNYIKCTTCSCLIDSSNSERVSFRIYDEKYEGMDAKDFGMDWLSFSVMEL